MAKTEETTPADPAPEAPLTPTPAIAARLLPPDPAPRL